MINYIILIILLLIIFYIIYLKKNKYEFFSNVINKKILENNIKYNDIAKNIDNDIINNNVKYNEPKYRYYKEKENKTKYAYSTIVIIDEKYIPSALSLAYSLKKNNSKNDIIIFIQDNPYYIYDDEGNIVNVFEGISYKTIEDLKKIYDEVIGFDLFKIDDYKPNQEHFTSNKHYSNISYYVSKLIILSYQKYEKIFYMDSSVIINKNIDYIFKQYDKSTFIHDEEWVKYNVGLRGTFFLYVPKKHYYYKTLFLIKNFKKYFTDDVHLRGIDEFILYYTIYPNWSENLLSPKFGCSEFIKKKLDCDLYYYQINKPFLKNDKKKNNNYKKYEYWDKNVNLLLKEYPDFKKYYEHIKNFRKVNFDV